MTLQAVIAQCQENRRSDSRTAGTGFCLTAVAAVEIEHEGGNNGPEQEQEVF